MEQRQPLGAFDLRWVLTRPEKLRSHVDDIMDGVQMAWYDREESEGEPYVWVGLSFKDEKAAKSAQSIIRMVYPLADGPTSLPNKIGRRVVCFKVSGDTLKLED